VGSLAIGGGIAAMHYIGMEAMRMPAVMEYHAARVFLSIVVAVAVSLAALLLTFRNKQEPKASPRKLLTALIMGSAIPLMHYTGMWAVDFRAAEAPMAATDVVHISALGIAAITLTSFLVMALAIASSFIERTLATQTALANAAREGEAQFRTLGAIPQVMAFSDVYQALQTGVVDGQENTWSNIYTQKMHEVQKYMTTTNHGYIGYVVIVNKKFWDGLPGDIRDQLSKAMKEATEFGNGASAQDNDEALEAIKKSGKSEIIALTPDQDEAMRKAMMPVYKDVASRVGQPLIDEFLKETGRAPMN